MTKKTNKAADTKAVQEKKAAPAEVKAQAKPAETKPTEVKAAVKPAETKAAAVKASEKKPAAKKPAAKSAEKPAAKKAAPKKAKQPTIDDIVAKLYAKVDKAKAVEIPGTIAVDIEVYGAVNGHLYIEVKDGAVSVEPYGYDDYTVRAAINAEDAFAYVGGKLTLADAFGKSLYAEGNIGAALKIASLLK